MNEERQTCQMGCKVTNQLELKVYQSQFRDYIKMNQMWD